MSKKEKQKTRVVLAILTNRFIRSQKPRFIELSCKPDGTILKERVLRAEPTEAIYDEVWTNDEGKKSLDTCARMSRLYGHPLQRPAK